MVTEEAETGTAEIKRDGTMALVEEAEAVVMVEVVVIQEAEETTATTTMQEEVMAASMKAEEAAKGMMDTTTTSTRRTNNKSSCIFNNKFLRQFLCLILRPVLDHSFRTITWTATPIRLIAMSIVANGATKGRNNDCDQPHLV